MNNRASMTVTNRYSELKEQEIRLSLSEVKRIIIEHLKTSDSQLVNKDCLNGEATIEIQEDNDGYESVVLTLKKITQREQL